MVGGGGAVVRVAEEGRGWQEQAGVPSFARSPQGWSRALSCQRLYRGPGPSSMVPTKNLVRGWRASSGLSGFAQEEGGVAEGSWASVIYK